MVTLGVATTVALSPAALGAATRAPQAWASEPSAASLVTRILRDLSCPGRWRR